MRFDFLCSILLIAAVACGGDDDGTGDDGTGDDDGVEIDGGEDGADGGTRADAGPPSDGGVTGDSCGGFANLKCADTHFCDWREDSCGVADEPGECQPRPTECEPERPTVCGCDGKRYDNACEAEKAGTDVAEISVCGAAAGR